MTRFEVIHRSRIQPNMGEFLEMLYQGPSGCFGVRRVFEGVGAVPMYQVTRVHREKGGARCEDVSEPFLTPEGGAQFAKRCAGAEHGEMVARYGD